MAAKKHTTPSAQLDLSFAPPEEWRSIPGHEGWYEVSSLGRVRSLDRYTKDTHAPFYWRKYQGKLLRPFGRRHLQVQLRKDGARTYAYIHTLVLLTFIGPRPGNLVCNHRDGNPQNNLPGNLEWVTQGRNIEHAYEIGKRQRGERHSSAKLTAEQVREIRQRAAQGEKKTLLAQEFGVHQSHLGLIVRGGTWKHLI